MRRDQSPRQRGQPRRRRPNRLGQRGAGDQVDQIVLAQVDERQTEHPRVAPADRARHGTHLGEQVGAHQRRSEVQRRHRSQRISSKETVERLPEVTPEHGPVLDHHPPDLDLAALLETRPGPPPTRGGGRDRPVEDRPEVEHRVHPGRGGRELLRPAPEDEAEASRGARGTRSSGRTRARARSG